MAYRGKKSIAERREALAKGYNGLVLIEWLEEIADTYADLRVDLKDVSTEARALFAKIIDQELIAPLKSWNRPKSEPVASGDESE